ncbi:hypothetical protein JRO89_XS02G0200100 [Xanthoceras sorbifolium]|uniref:Cytochrome P450 n=1 Tax=Xanthoceras sorbifolium TaxID=99658 RepID=A0ABQ8IGB5_9ROSI|nr:hypothetical protein JRO89_XS02G0200100 [Xanthoceras sorbifolium]
MAGLNPSTSIMTSLVIYLSELPHIYNQVLKVIRLSPPSQGSFREALNDFVFNGFSIPKGWKLYWSVYSTHKNPECFPNPQNFDPTRFEGNGPAPYTFVPFRGGAKMCPRKEYVRLQVLMFMNNVVKRFKWKKRIPNKKIIVKPIPIPLQGLPVRLIPHKA